MYNPFNKSQIDYGSLHEDLLKCLGQSLKDNELKRFISKYQINCEDKYNSKYFNCTNDFIQFQNRDQRKQKIEEFHIKPNDQWLPYGILKTDTDKSIAQKFGEPDLIDYEFGIFYYYDKLIMISFIDFKGHQSTISKITYSNKLKNKPSEDELRKWRKERLLSSKNRSSKVFGLSSKWLIIQTKEFHKTLKIFGISENNQADWQEGFNKSTIRGNGVFISKVLPSKILIHGWPLPAIEIQKDFYKDLSIEIGEVYYFENHIKSPFAWAKIKRGEIERIFREEYFETTLNSGSETEYEIAKNFNTVKRALFDKDEEYLSDQDVKFEYRKYMNEFTIELASNWVFDPRSMDEIELPDMVYLNENYRQQL